MNDESAAMHGNWRKGFALDIANKDAVVHAICPYLRDLKDCKRCPEWTEDKLHGQVKRGCYALAEEVMNICQTGHPHRKPSTKMIEIPRMDANP